MRKIEEIRSEYGQAAAQLGELAYKQSLAEDNIGDLEHQQRKLLNKMQSLAKEAVKLREAQAEVALPPVQESKDESEKA